MIFADKGNRIKQISESDIDKYVGQGYKIVDERGRLIQDTIPTDITVLQSAFSENKAKIKKLETENATLKQEIAELKDQLKKSKPIESVKETPVQDETPVPEQELPKKTSRRQR